MSLIRCEGTVQTDPAGAAVCLDGGGLPLTWTVEAPFEISSIDPVVAGELFGLGFVLYGTAWVIGKSTAMIVNAIKLL